MSPAKDSGSSETAASAVRVEVVAPFQVYWNQVAHVAGDVLELPADVVDRYVQAGWVTPSA